MVMHTEIKSIHTGEDWLVQVLLQQKLCNWDAIKQMQTHANQFQQTLFQYLSQYHCIEPEKLCNACGDFFNLKKINLNNKNCPDLATDHFPFQLIKNNFLLPVSKNEKQFI